MYYIYHIPGKKIGCTKQPNIRVKEQNYTNYEILETHTDLYEASKREIELQKQYGYRVDSIQYYQTLAMHSKEGMITGGKTQGRINSITGQAANQFRKVASLGGKTSHKKHPELYSKMGKELGKIQAQSKSTCPHCNKIGQTRVMGRWHFDNCKHKIVK